MDFEILISHSFSRADLSVAYIAGPGESRSREATEQIDKAWESLALSSRESGLTVFDGNLFRLDRYGLREGKMHLELGDTSFREYVGTSIGDFYNRHPDVWMADPLAVCIALVTDDRKILVEKRTTPTRYRAPFHVIGGFMEREKDFLHGQPDPFFAIVREVKEELGLSLSPEDPVALGLVRNLWVRHPEIVFFCRVGDSLENVKRTFAQSVTDGEIDQLQAAEDDADGLASFLKNHHQFFTGSGMACLLLYGKRVYGEDWYNSLFRKLANR